MDPRSCRFEQIEVGEPGPGQALLRQTTIGLNYIDVYFRSGLYPPPTVPFIPGLEGAGVVEAVGEGVSEVRVGQRVAYAAPPIGAYAERRLMPADRLVALPDGISDEQAAAMMLKGMTAQYLLRRTYRVEPGQTILFHAAAGGVGLIACQWAKHLGATVIGTVGERRQGGARAAHGCAHVVRYDREDVVARVREITDGKGVPVVYDSVGQATFDASLDCLAARGMLVSFGQSSGKIAPVDLGILEPEGLALRDPSDADDLHRGAPRSARGRARSCSRWSEAARSRFRSTSASRCATPPRRTARSKAAVPPARRCCLP